MNKVRTNFRIGEINYNNFGSKMEIIKYRRNDDIDVYFEEYNWVFKETSYQKFQKGNISCPYEKRVYGIGYYGEGEYKCRKNGKDTKCYKTWHHMIERCYDEKHRNKHPTYIDCTVCEEWHNFQNFAKWYEENYYECNNEQMHLDKDILVKGNKIYSPQTCIFVPARINTLFVKKDKNRGEYPIGVSYHDRGENLRIRCCDINNKVILLGFCDLNQPFKAFSIYKEYKERVVKEVADIYKEIIPEKLYKSMYNYTVNIND